MLDDKKPLSQPHARRHWLEWFKHRWPTALGLALVLLTAVDGAFSQEFVLFLSSLIIFIALVYLSAAVLERRSSAWIVFVIGLVLLVTLRLLDLSAIAVASLLLVALAFLGWGVTQGQWGSRNLPPETFGMVIFTATALVALNVNTVWAGYLAAAALFGHAAWDVYHHVRDKVVVRSYAEFCAVLDVFLGVAILIMMGKMPPN